MGVDLIAQSFVRSAADVIGLRALMGWREVPIVAKIETRPAIEGVDAILAQADGVMVARGDLGVELPMEDVPLLQKELLRSARAAGRPTIVATQMLESMIHAAADAGRGERCGQRVLDGADAVMLSGETAIGEYPLEAAAAAERIASVAEEHAAGFRTAGPAPVHADEAAAVAHAAAQIAEDDPAVVAIACYTETGRTASLLSAERPRVPIYAFVPDPRIAARSTSGGASARSRPSRRPTPTLMMRSWRTACARAARYARGARSSWRRRCRPARPTRTC